MKVNFKQELKNPMDNDPVWENEKKEKVSTLSDICIQALFSQLKGDENLNGKKKFELFELAQKIKDQEVDLKVEEIALIKERVGKAFVPLMVGIVYSILD